jgi:putative transcriptional regulator
MSHDLSSNSYLNGQLLLAVPSLRDSYFARSVVFLAAHSDEDGSFGYILNRPLKQRVGDLMPDQDLGPLG